MAKFEIPEGFRCRRSGSPRPDRRQVGRWHGTGARRKQGAQLGCSGPENDIVTGVRLVSRRRSRRFFAVLRKRWNTAKDAVCVNAATGDVVAGVLERGLRRRIRRRGGCLLELARPPAQGTRAGKRVGFCGLVTKKAATPTGCRFQPGRCASNSDRRHLTLPVIGTVRTHENTRRVERLIRRPSAGAGDQRAPQRHRFDASVRVLVARPSSPTWHCRSSRVGVDVGCVVLARSPAQTAQCRTGAQSASA